MTANDDKYLQRLIDAWFDKLTTNGILTGIDESHFNGPVLTQEPRFISRSMIDRARNYSLIYKRNNNKEEAEKTLQDIDELIGS